MVDPVVNADEFGAGLDAEQVVQTPVEPNPVMTWASSMFDNVPTDFTPEGLADQIETWRTRAEQADEYQRKVQEYEARILAGAAVPEKPAEATPTPAQVAAERRYQVKAVDPALRAFLTDQYVVRDPNTGYVKPKGDDVLLPHVAAAIQAQNASIQDEARIARALTGEFDSVFDDALQHNAAIKAQNERIAALEAQLKAQVEPLQKTAAEMAQERFLWQHQNVLYQDDPANPGNKIPNAAGELFATLTENGMANDKAIEIVKATASKFVAPVEKPAPAAPKRQTPAQGIRRRVSEQPTERAQVNGLLPPAQGWKRSWSEITAEAMAQGDN